MPVPAARVRPEPHTARPRDVRSPACLPRAVLNIRAGHEARPAHGQAAPRQPAGARAVSFYAGTQSLDSLGLAPFSRLCLGPPGPSVSYRAIPALLTAWSAPQVVRPLLLKWLAALCLLDCAAAAESTPPVPPVLTLNVTYYDFRVHEDGHNNPVSHPDFERNCKPGPHSFDPCLGETGLVEATLGADGRRRTWGTVHIHIYMAPCIAMCVDGIVISACIVPRPVHGGLLTTRDFGPQARLHSWRLALHAKLHHV